MKRTASIFAALLLVLPGFSRLSGQPSANCYTVFSLNVCPVPAGGATATSGSYRLFSTTGQGIIGTALAESRFGEFGFWYRYQPGDQRVYRIARLTAGRGWNMLSLPVCPDGWSVQSLFPGAASKAFQYNSVYRRTDSICPGPAYWVKFDSARSWGVRGVLRVCDSVHVNRGWNMVGAPNSPVAVSDVRSDPSGLITGYFFGFSGVYRIADTLFPGGGYWVKVSQQAVLYLGTGIGPAPKRGAPITVIGSGEMPPPPPGETALPAAAVPAAFCLDQNYPNPANPSTVFRYGVPEPSHVSLVLYSLLGERIAVLFEGERAGGYYTQTVDLRYLASGVYFFRMTAGSWRDVRKMMVMK